MIFGYRFSFVLTACLCLSACESSHRPAPVDNRWAKVNSSQRVYKVQAGDTLYSIAWKFAKPYQQLAAYNHLPAPYTVFPGQTLRLTGSMPVKKVVSVANVTVPNAVRVDKAAAAEVTLKAPMGRGTLPWPVKGKVIAEFGQNGNKGIDIAVPMATPVKAVDAGTVVYAGDNLHGYGQLVIIKQANDLMTAYAHNSKLLVKEGSSVTREQTIALSGDSDSSVPLVHFELRQAGKPQNPLNFLN